MLLTSSPFLGMIAMLFLFGTHSITGHAQQVIRSTDTSSIKPIANKRVVRIKPFAKDISVGFRLNTTGWSAFGEYAIYKPKDYRRPEDFYDARIYTLEFTEKKHPREIKRKSANASSPDAQSNNFIYAKQNNFYALKLGYGGRRMIAGKPEVGNVSVHWVYSGGFALGMLKPYYINAYVFQNGNFSIKSFKYSDTTRTDFLDAQKIVGSDKLTKGIGEIKFVPGIHARAGIHFDLATKKQNVFGIETGVSAEYYTQKMDIMVDQKAYPYSGNIYLSVQFGKRIRSEK